MSYNIVFKYTIGVHFHLLIIDRSILYQTTDPEKRHVILIALTCSKIFNRMEFSFRLEHHRTWKGIETKKAIFTDSQSSLLTLNLIP